MRKLLIFLFFISFNFLKSQDIINPVKWNFNHEISGDSIITLNFDATIDDKWHLYSQNIKDEPPLSTVFLFNDPYAAIKKINEGVSISAFDPIFEKNVKYFTNSATFNYQIKFNDTIGSISGSIDYQACDDELCVFRSDPFIFKIKNDYLDNKSEVDDKSLSVAKSLDLGLAKSEYLYKNNSLGSQNKFWNIFLLGFLGGVLALLTPCVFPMIPLTVSYFIKNDRSRSESIKDSLIYSFFIILIYVLLSLPFHIFDSLDPEILNVIATNVFVNVLFFIIFIYFAFSFFGFYELKLPYNWSKFSDSASTNNKGVFGLFFMALTLAIVSFSCTGPILGSLLAGSLSSNGGATQLTIGMLGFGFALSFPFGLFSLFPKALNLIPKSGTWLNTTNIVIGFVELALALKFLSNADLVSHWGILKREVFISIWALISLLTSFYLLGFFRFPHETKHKIKLPRRIIGLLFISFTIYLVNGLFVKDKLRLLSGFPPPIFYSLSNLNNECPLNLECYKDFFEGRRFSKKTNKPILIDFTGWACVNCRKMEENVWSDKEVYEILDNEIVLTSLYVDDRKKLPEGMDFKFRRSDGTIKNIKTIGQKWSTFQYLNFNTASQPYYVLMAPDGKLLNEPIQYANTITFKNWLQNGINVFKNSQ